MSSIPCRAVILYLIAFSLCLLLLSGVLVHNELPTVKFPPTITKLHQNPTDNTEFLEAKDVNKNRIKLVEEICKRYDIGLPNGTHKYPPAPQYSVFYYNMYDRMALCPIYKAGSTTWLYNLCILGGETEDRIKNSKEQLSTIARRIYPELGYDQAKTALETSKKIMVVRHPFERLLSAYRDKLENVNIGWEHGTGHFYRKYGAKIVKKIRKGGTDALAVYKKGTYFWDRNKPTPSGIEPTFKEFVRYLISTDLLNYADDHWIPYNMFCTPCLVKYDFISKVETLDKDQMFVIKELGLEMKINPRWLHNTLPQNVTKQYISEIYFSQLNQNEVRLLYKKYFLDFIMFGYLPDKYYKYAKIGT